jgi:ribosomal protein L1
MEWEVATFLSQTHQRNGFRTMEKDQLLKNISSILNLIKKKKLLQALLIGVKMHFVVFLDKNIS